MNNLVKITQTNINGTEINSVNAKELHIALGLKNKFTNWMKKQNELLEDYEEGLDYIRTTKSGDSQVIVKDGLNLQGKECEYILSLDMAKHISLMSKSKKGKEVRHYFIEAEKKNAQPLIAMDDVIKSLQLTAQGLKHQDERLDDQHKRINAQHNIIVSQDDRLIQLENNVRLTNQQEYELTQVHHKKVYELARLYGEDQNDKKLISKLHRQVWKLFKNHFMLPRFNELQANKFNDGIAFLNGIKLKDI